jgi:hypothetical protein
MTEPTARAILYRKIAAVSGAVGSAAKDGRNKDQNYTYATPASVINAVKPHMAEQGIAIVPHLIEFAEIDTGTRSGGGKPYIINRVSMHYHILDGETGEEMIVPWQAQAGTYGDDKGLAKAQTIALRTFLLQLFQVPAEDPEIDPDARDARPMPEMRNAAPPAQQSRQAVVKPEPKAPTTKPNRDRLLALILERTQDAIGLGLSIDLPKPLAEMAEDELIAYGKKLRSDIDMERAAQQVVAVGVDA